MFPSAALSHRLASICYAFKFSMIQSTTKLPATKTWTWQGFPICYQTQGTAGPAVVLVHGFGASWWHWRKNIPVLAENCRVYAIDLIGFGASSTLR